MRPSSPSQCWARIKHSRLCLFTSLIIVLTVLSLNLEMNRKDENIYKNAHRPLTGMDLVLHGEIDNQTDHKGKPWTLIIPVQTPQPQPPKPKPVYLRADSKDRVWLAGGKPVPNCPVECYFDGSPAASHELTNVDAIMFTRYRPDSTGDTILQRDESILRVLYHSESESIYKVTLDDYKQAGSYFDIITTYHLPEDKTIRSARVTSPEFSYFTVFYAEYKLEEFYKPHLTFSQKTRASDDALATTFISNCDITTSGRLQIISELLKNGVTIHSYGNCGPSHRDAKQVEGCSGKQKYEEKLCVQSTYKFTLAFENSIDESYVTEKVFHGLMAGTVPVYLGAPNIDKFLPTYGTGKKCIIDVSDFDTPEELAEYVKKVSQDEQLYNSYMEWKKLPPAESFVKMLNAHPACDMCKEVSRLRSLGLDAIRNRRKEKI